MSGWVRTMWRRATQAMVLTLAVAASTPALAGYAHFIMDANSGKVLDAQDADTLNHPASLTKMMTLYMVFEALHDGRLRWDQRIVMSANGARTTPTKLGLRQGETYTVREAVLGMIVKSANDVAEGIGDHLYGSEEKFAAAMTRKARQLGMSRTVFRNGSGLPDSQQVTTARDMARLGLALIRDFPQEYRLFSTQSFAFRGRTIRGHNNLMYRYKGMDGIKTGYTNASGFNLVSAVNDNGRRVIGVVLGGRTARARDAQMASLLDKAMPKAGTRAGAGLVAEAPSSPAPLFPTRLPRNNVPMPVVAQEVATTQPPRPASPAMAPAMSEPPVAAVAPVRPVVAERYQPVPSVPVRSQPEQAPTQVASVAPSSASLGYAAPSKSDLAPPADLPFKTAAAPGWRVQLGATGSEDEAISLLGRAMDKLDGKFQNLTPYTETLHSGSATLHRARFSGFTNQAAAQSACKLLSSAKFACQVVPAGG
ncbi:serine hydrolase [Rhizobium lemnae]|nr:serine hydrolase [Rhizobium lemnae]MCJ8509246.1 serine hydrolase [Rhizobium lemnae]